MQEILVVAGRFRKELREESPGSTGQRCWITSSEGNFKESATENNRLKFFKSLGKDEKAR